MFRTATIELLCTSSENGCDLVCAAMLDMPVG
jgi:hypothetical protein